MLFKDSFYQLTDYLPRKSPGSQGTHGRAWSVRRGIVGLAWRLEENRSESTVPNNVKELIQNWGMLKEEAEVAPERQTSLCYLVKAQNQSPVAAIYLDAEAKDQFGERGAKALMAVIEQSVESYGLCQSLEQVWGQVRGSSPLIELYGANK